MRGPVRLAVLALAALAAAARPARAAVATLVLRSSATIETGGTTALSAAAIDANDNAVVAGLDGSQGLVAKYSRNLLQMSSASFSGGSSAQAAATGPGGRIAVLFANAGHMAVAVYDTNLVMLSSAALTVGAVQDLPQAVTFDGSGNVYVVGSAFDGAQFQYLIAKFTAGLALTTSLTVSNPAGAGVDLGYGVAIDASSSVYVTGQSMNGSGDWTAWTLKYPESLAGSPATATLTPPAGTSFQGRAVRAAASGKIVVAGHEFPTAAGTPASPGAALYTAALSLVSSGTYATAVDDQVNGAAVDGSGDVYVAGQAGGTDAFLVKFSPAMVVVATADFANGNGGDGGFAAAVDSKGNPVVAGETNDGVNQDALVLRYNGPPLLSAATPALQGGSAQSVTLTGDNFASGATVGFTNTGIASIGATPNGSTQLLVGVNVDPAVPLGSYGVTVTNPDGSAVSVNGLFQVVQTIAVNASSSFSGGALGQGGSASVSGSAGAFTQNVTLTLDQPSSIPSPGAFSASGVALEVQADVPGTLATSYSVTLSYANATMTGLDQTKLVVAVYDPLQGAWVAMTSTPDPSGKTVTATVTKLGVLQIMQPGAGGGGGGGGTGGGSGIPASARHEVFAGPNPYKPGSGGPFDDPASGSGIVFYNLTPSFRLEIFNANGARVFRYDGPSSGGQYRWDTGTYGGAAGSGVYIFRAYDADGRLLGRGKLAIIR